MKIESRIWQLVANELRRRGRHGDFPRIVFDVLVKAGIDPLHEPDVEHIKQLLVVACGRAPAKRLPEKWPGDFLVLDHLDRLTDTTGLIQSAVCDIPGLQSGYATETNACALRLCLRLWTENPDPGLLDRSMLYLRFLEHAWDPIHGFRNSLSEQRSWMDGAGTESCQGQAVLALAEVLASRLPEECRHLATARIIDVLPALADLQDLRAQAYLILAWGVLWKLDVPELKGLQGVAQTASRRLVESYLRSRSPAWAWFEPQLRSANAVLPHALFIAARCWPSASLLNAAVSTFAFLDQVTTCQSFFSPIGTRGWYTLDGERAVYDQLPGEAATMGEAALVAFGLLGDEHYLATFHRTHNWFSGQNSLQYALADRRTGGCCDGLQQDAVNRNQGAESTLAWLWSAANHADIAPVAVSTAPMPHHSET